MDEAWYFLESLQYYQKTVSFDIWAQVIAPYAWML